MSISLQNISYGELIVGVLAFSGIGSVAVVLAGIVLLAVHSLKLVVSGIMYNRLNGMMKRPGTRGTELDNYNIKVRFVKIFLDALGSVVVFAIAILIVLLLLKVIITDGTLQYIVLTLIVYISSNMIFTMITRISNTVDNTLVPVFGIGTVIMMDGTTPERVQSIGTSYFWTVSVKNNMKVMTRYPLEILSRGSVKILPTPPQNII